MSQLKRIGVSPYQRCFLTRMKVVVLLTDFLMLPLTNMHYQAMSAVIVISKREKFIIQARKGCGREPKIS